MRPTYKVTELLGDGIGAELSRAVHELADALPIHLDFEPVDLTLENRRANLKTIYDQAVESVVAMAVIVPPRTDRDGSPGEDVDDLRDELVGPQVLGLDAGTEAHPDDDEVG